MVTSKGEEIFSKYSTFLNPNCPISKKSKELTGITDRDICNAPSFEEKWQEIHQFLKGKW